MIAMGKMEYHPNYDTYVEMIVAHPNYEGLYYDRSEEGKVRWVVTEKTPKGKLRKAWWNNTCNKLGIPIQKGCYAKAAKQIHPTGIHVCQCCGEGRSIYYEYPTVRTLKKINEAFDLNLKQTDYTIRQFVETYCTTKSRMDKLCDILKIPHADNVRKLNEYIKVELIDKDSSLFSPGAMCNPPDRFNGYHSYALCCRKEKDKGRHDDNMCTYIQDRRAYENWSDGDYNLANRLMGEFHKQPPMKCPICGSVENMSADHIGPISLGFCHSTHLTPMCKSCNSAKNNRFTKEDVNTLIELEDSGETVISWHSKYIWDLVKEHIQDDEDAKSASSIMAKCHQNILNILALIYKKTGEEFLMRYLHPEYSLVDYRFDNFDLCNLDKMTVIAKPLDSKNKRKNQERYIRKSFSSLEEFLSKKNRKNYLLIDEASTELKPVINAIELRQFDQADRKLKTLIEKVSQLIFDKETAIQ